MERLDHIVLGPRLKHPADLVLLDIMMPGIDGYDVCSYMRADESLRHIPVIMLTARGFAIEDEQKEQLRVSACLSKPFSPREVLATIEDVLKQDAAV